MLTEYISTRMDFVLFIHALCLFFTATFTFNLFRELGRLRWLWLALYCVSNAVGIALSLVANAQAEHQVLTAVSGSLSAMGFFFLALFGLHCLSSGRARSVGYALAAALTVLPAALSVPYGLAGFQWATVLVLAPFAGAVASVGALRAMADNNGRLITSAYPLLGLYVLLVSFLPGILLLFSLVMDLQAEAIWMADLDSVFHAALSAAVAAAFARSAAFLRGGEERASGGVLAYAYGITAVGFALFLGFTLTDLMGSKAEESVRKELYMRVSAVGNALDAADVGSLGARVSDVDLPPYQRMLRQLTRIRLANSDLRFVYMVDMDMSTRSIVFLLDTEPPTSEDYATPGEVYSEAPEELKQVFSTGQTVLVGPYTDRWGSWLSGFAPIRDDMGAVTGVVGMDIAATAFVSHVAGTRLTGMVITFLLAVIGAAVGVIVQRNELLRTANTRLSEELVLRERAERELVEANRHAEEANRAKSRFLATMSHEIRTPMNAIIGLTDIVLGGTLEPEQRDRLTTVKTAADHLTGIINDVLDFSRIEAGRMELEQMAFEPAGLVRGAVRALSAQARSKGIELIARLDPELPRTVVGDPSRLRQILFNLMGNAIKFTDKGRVTVSATQADGDGPDEVVLRFDVADTGVGIGQDRQKKIFESFTQAQASTSRRYGGSGLGLAICSQLVELMGGAISVRSTPGKGSTFTFTVRLAPDEGADAGLVPEAEQPLPDPGRLRILLVEDDPANVMVARLHLERLEHEVVHAASGEEALRMLGRERVDLVLMDLMMPGMDGLETTRQLRASAEVLDPDVPVVAMTAHARPEARDNAFAAGMDGFVTKPVNVDRLRESIARAMAGKGDVSDEKEGAASADGPQDGQGVPLDRRLALDNLGIRDEDFDGILSVSLRELDRQVDTLGQALDSGDWATATLLAHTMLNTASAVGARPCRDALAELERAVGRQDLAAAGAYYEAFVREFERLKAHLDNEGSPPA